jgi:predicted nucleic acid-binding protein
MTVVVDASVALKWFVNEDGSDRAVSLLNSGAPMIAPDLVLAEVCNAAWKSLRRREIDPAQLNQIAIDVAGPFQRLVSLDHLLRRAVAIAGELDHPVYDCLYLALVEAEDAPLITADRRLVDAVRGTPLADRVTPLA